MDEVTAELDVEARARLLAFLKEDSEGPMQLTVRGILIAYSIYACNFYAGVLHSSHF
jgi:ABC-type phosphonate transport system ATPase subunit